MPAKVLFELSVGLLLGIFWRADIRRQFYPLVSAIDASTEFGFGASAAKVPADLARRLACVAEKQGSFLALDGGLLQGEAARRLGKAHQLDLSMGDFVHLFSVRKQHEAHINVLEGEAFVLWLRWFLRSKSRHGVRTVVLVDSAVWVGAATKGRSSTQLNRLLRKAAALELAGQLQVYVVPVPSVGNPADAPSGGCRWYKDSQQICACRPPCPSQE